MTQLNDVQEAWLDAGIQDFDSGRYWHAHESWEDLWKSLKAQAADELHIKGIQGLIQCAALLFQYEKKNPRGVANMWSKLTAKLGLPDDPKIERLWSVDVERLLVELAPFMRGAAADEAEWGLNPLQIRLA